MHRAVELAERGRRTAAPNPWVGCVVVGADGESVLAEGYHIAPGRPHAEAAALADAAARGVSAHALAGATLYCTLEPCHAGPGKRTPPCDEAIVRAGIKRVVVAQQDPDPLFGGAGLATLRAAGIDVCVGAGAAAAAASLEPYLHQRRTRRPFCVVKTAVSIDGAIGCADGSSQWITGEAARADAHELRALSHAIVVGSGTALRDRPRLNVRAQGAAWAARGAEGADAPPPLRVLLDARGRVREGPLLDPSIGPTLVFTSAACDPAALSAWAAAGVQSQVVAADEARGGLELGAVLDALGERRIIQVMFEGGPTLHSRLLEAGLADRLQLYVGNCLLGAGSQPWLSAPIARTIADKQLWSLRDVRRLGQDVRLVYGRATGDA